MHSHFQITIHSPATASAIATIDTGLDDFNIAEATLADVRPLHVIAEVPTGVVVGGAIGRTWGDCCELQQLWVLPTLRGIGVGSQLMVAFEREAKNRGCLLVYLDTFSFQAPAFYQARGYQEVLRTAGFTGGVIKFTMHKDLGASATVA